MGGGRKDLTGQVFGDLIALAYSHTDPISRCAMWTCRCSCGVEKDIRGNSLRDGTYKSCGCKRIERRDKGVKTHIEGDAIDGSRASALNAKLHVGNKSGHKGVRFNGRRNKWAAYIGFKGKQISLGYHPTEAGAIKARKDGELLYHKPILDKHAETKKAPT